MAATFTYQAVLALAIDVTMAYANGANTGPLRPRFALNANLTNGTTDGKIDRAWFGTYSGIGAGVTTTIDLAGALTDPSGATISFAEVCAIFIRNKSSTAANGIKVGPAASNGFGIESGNKGFWADASDRNFVQADSTADVTGGGSCLLLYNISGCPVVAGTGDQFVIITGGSASSAAFDVLVLGRSA